MSEINKKLITVGNEIIKDNPNSNPRLSNSNVNEINNNVKTIENELTSTITKNEKERIINHYINSKANLNNLNTYNRNYFLYNTTSPNETKKSYYSNISKINYKDGIILKDANNPNPGHGLWAIKLSEELKPRKKSEEKDENINNSMNSYNSNIFSNKLFNNVNNIKLNENIITDNNLDSVELFDIDAYEGEVDKLIINKLTRRSNKLEKKYNDILIKYYERENLYLNLEKHKKEYEQLIKESVKEKEEIQKNCEKLDNNNQALVNSILNARKEIERLIVVIKEEQNKIMQEIEKYNKRLVAEEEKRKRIINEVRYTERQISLLQDKIESDKREEDINNNNNKEMNSGDTSRELNKTNKSNKSESDKIKNKNNLLFDEQTKKFYKIKKETKREKELKIKRKKEYIMQLQEELERLKIEDEEKMNEKKELFRLINEKNMKNKKYKNDMNIMFNELEKQKRNNKWNNSSIQINRNIIYNFKKHSNSQ
jgi:hypothetical protein